MEKIDYKELAARMICFLILGVLGIMFFKYLFAYFVPFIIAYAIALAIYPLARELSARIKVSRKICAGFLVFILLVIVMCLIFLTVNRLIYEMERLFSYLTENSDAIAEKVKGMIDSVNSFWEGMPIISGLQDTEIIESVVENINKVISSIWESLLSALGSAAPSLAGNIVTALPNAVFVSVVTVVACFYFAIDLEALQGKMKEILPKGVKRFLRGLKWKTCRALKKYVKAYFILFLITFGELLAGFLVLGIDYSFLLAIIIALLDFLPLIGTAAILTPWGIIHIVMGNYYLGIGLLILLGVITVVRQIIEPKIVGESLGVHPILTLISMYLGFRLFGFLGMLILPIAVLLFFSGFKVENRSKK